MRGPVRYALLLLLLPVLVVPLDFVSAAPWARTAVALSAGTGWLVLLVFSLRRRPWAAPVLVAAVGSLLLTAVVSGGAASTAVTYGALAAGFSIGALLRSGQRLLAALFVLSVLVLLLELAIHRHLFLELLGTPLFEYYEGVGFRSRGVQGHPVPAAFAVVALAVALWRAPVGHGPVLPRPLLAVGAVAALAATGTRSVLVVGALLLLVSATRRHRSAVALGGVVALWSASVIAVVSQLRGGAGDLPRFLDFGAVRGSESFSIRASGLEVLSDLGTGCGLPCVVAGNGDRALQSAVPTVRAATGPATVDNQFLTIFYDHGVVAVALLALLVLSVYRVLHRPAVSPHRRSAALAVLCLLLGGLFFDAFYVKTVMCLIGVLVAVTAEAPSTSPGEDDRDDRPPPVGVPGDLRVRPGDPAPLR